MARNSHYRIVGDVDEEKQMEFPEPKPTKQYEEPIGPRQPEPTLQYDEPIGPKEREPKPTIQYKQPLRPGSAEGGQPGIQYKKPIGPEERKIKVTKQYNKPIGPEPQYTFPNPKPTKQYAKPIGPTMAGTGVVQYTHPIGPPRPTVRQRVQGRVSDVLRATPGAASRAADAVATSAAGTLWRSARGESLPLSSEARAKLATDKGLRSKFAQQERERAVAEARQKAASAKGRKQFTGETKELSRVLRKSAVGSPMSIIGTGGTRAIVYQSRGEGRSGRRATLEWRRENRQYVSPQRRDAASINQDWVNVELLGIEPEPVRIRRVHTEKGKRVSQLDWFVKNL